MPTSDAVGSIPQRLAGAAAAKVSAILGYNVPGQTTASMEETNAILLQLTKDRERLSQKLAAEADARKRVERERSELEKKLRLAGATSQVEGRKARDVSEELARKKDELAEMRQMMQHQTIEIANLQNAKLALERRLMELEKKISRYDDSFYSLEARNVRDRTRMDEMGKAKNNAEQEKNIYKHMLEQAHERWLKERQELRRDCQGKMEASNTRIQQQQHRITLLEKTLHELSQVQEEVKMYKAQCQDLMEKLSARAVGQTPPRSGPVRPGVATSTPPSASSQTAALGARALHSIERLRGSMRGGGADGHSAE